MTQCQMTGPVPSPLAHRTHTDCTHHPPAQMVEVYTFLDDAVAQDRSGSTLALLSAAFNTAPLVWLPNKKEAAAAEAADNAQQQKAPSSLQPLGETLTYCVHISRQGSAHIPIIIIIMCRQFESWLVYEATPSCGCPVVTSRPRPPRQCTAEDAPLALATQ